MERLLSQKPVEMERANSQREGAEKSLSNSKSIERAVSQKAMQLSASVHCKAAAAGFFCGACMTYLCFAAAWMPFRMSAFNGAMPFHRSPGPGIQASGRTPAGNALSIGANLGRMYRLNSSNARLEDVSSTGKGRERKDDGRPKFRKQKLDDERISLLLSAWEAYFLGSRNQNVGVDWSNVPKAPHIENCKARVEASDQLDNRGSNGSRPPWTAWKGYLGLKVGKSIVHSDMGEELLLEHETVPDGPYPPWIEGGDEDNLPMTRRVQHDLWLHQHPHNCRDPKVRFLLTDWERHSGFGIGAQIAAMAGMLALAINQKRILVTNYFNRADHEGCVLLIHTGHATFFWKHQQIVGNMP